MDKLDDKDDIRKVFDKNASRRRPVSSLRLIECKFSGKLTPTLSAWSLHGITALKSTLLETLFLGQVHDFLCSFFKAKFMKENSFLAKN